MDERFATLAEWLCADGASVLEAAEDPGEVEAPDSTADAPCAGEDADLADDVFSSIRCVRAALEDAIEMMRADLIADIAAEIVGRELRLAPAELDTIVETAVARYADESPCVVRVNPTDVEKITSGVRVVPDSSLRTGDVVVEVRAGSIDARLGTRLERILHRYA